MLLTVALLALLAQPEPDPFVDDRGRRRLVRFAAAQLLISGPQYRLEFGTDTRGGEILAGCGLAILLHRRPDARRPVAAVARAGRCRRARRRSSCWRCTNDYDPPWLLRGGYSALSLVSAVLVLSLLVPNRLTSALGWRPLAAVGIASYSIYLVHWPVILILTPDRTGMSTVGARRRQDRRRGRRCRRASISPSNSRFVGHSSGTERWPSAGSPRPSPCRGWRSSCCDRRCDRRVDGVVRLLVPAAPAAIVLVACAGSDGDADSGAGPTVVTIESQTCCAVRSHASASARSRRRGRTHRRPRRRRPAPATWRSTVARHGSSPSRPQRIWRSWRPRRRPTGRSTLPGDGSTRSRTPRRLRSARRRP